MRLFCPCRAAHAVIKKRSVFARLQFQLLIPHVASHPVAENFVPACGGRARRCRPGFRRNRLWFAPISRRKRREIVPIVVDARAEGRRDNAQGDHENSSHRPTSPVGYARVVRNSAGAGPTSPHIRGGKVALFCELHECLTPRSCLLCGTMAFCRRVILGSATMGSA